MDLIYSLDPTCEIPGRVFYISVAFLSSLAKNTHTVSIGLEEILPGLNGGEGLSAGLCSVGSF